jgi:hypothetical protein
VKAPAATDSAVVMVVSGSFSDARLSHEAAAETGATVAQLPARDTKDTTENTVRTRVVRKFIASLLFGSG